MNQSNKDNITKIQKWLRGCWGVTENLQIQANGTAQQSTKMVNKCKPRAVDVINNKPRQYNRAPEGRAGTLRQITQEEDCRIKLTCCKAIIFQGQKDVLRQVLPGSGRKTQAKGHTSAFLTRV